jgi:hypothetical protein
VNSKLPIIDHDIFIIRKLLLIIGIISFVLGVISVSYQWMNLGSLLLLASTLFLFKVYLINEKYKQYKKIYSEYLPENKVADLLNHGSFEFTNEFLNYNTKKDIQKINWSDFFNYQLVNSKHIVLFNKDSKKNLIISETEMDKFDFLKIVGFIKEKVEKNTQSIVKK